jgi:hypothetical protein
VDLQSLHTKQRGAIFHSSTYPCIHIWKCTCTVHVHAFIEYHKVTIHSYYL